jgi:hypothetical protein
MASTYSSLLQLELIGSGQQANSWGNTTNNNLQYGLEYSITGVYTKNLSAASSPILLLLLILLVQHKQIMKIDSQLLYLQGMDLTLLFK